MAEKQNLKTCPTRELLSLYGHGAVSRDEGVLVEAHIKICSSCARYVEEIEAVLTLAAPSKLEDPGPEFNSEIWRQIIADKAKRRTRWTLYPTLAAAALVLVFVLPFGDSNDGPEEGELVEQLGLFQNIELMENLELVESIESLMGELAWEENDS